MSDLKRYKLVHQPIEGFATMCVRDDGKYVSYQEAADAIEAIQADNARLREALGACARGDITIVEAGRISRAALGDDNG